MIRRILLALDGSPRAERAIPYGIALGRAFDAEVVLLRVVEGHPASREPSTDPVEWRLARSEAVAYLEGIKPRFVDAEVEVDVDVSVGPPAEEILETAHVRRADVVALTSHGRGEASAGSMAGTAHKVVAGADTSVLVVPGASEEPPPELRRIVVGVDGSPRSEWALSLAATLARGAGVPLLLIHVVPAPEILEAGDTETIRRLVRQLVDAGREAGQHYLAGLSARLEAPDLQVRARTVAARTSVPRALAEILLEEPGSLLVLSARGTSAVEGCTYGGVAWTLVGGGEHPVLVLQDARHRKASPEPAPEEVRGARRRKGQALR